MANNSNLEESAQLFINDPTDDHLDIMVENARGLILHFVKKYGLGQIQEDLIQAGYEGLVKSIKGYDPQKGVRFVTYASHWIIGEIRHEIRRLRRFDCPSFIIDIQDKMGRVMDDYFKEFGDFPSVEYISKKIKITEEGIREAMQGGLVSLDEMDLSKIQSIASENFQLRVEDKVTLYKAFSKISALQRKVLYLLFFQNKTQAETAEILKTNQRQVSRIKEKGLQSIKEKLKENV